ncbi:XRE family transcriptional regulator [Actinokineospora sp. PR83]|nr:XRE family transcriptional regulator [Actinokineospora sp. PR83]
MSQDQVASRLGVDRTAVMRIESGARKVSALELGALAELFGVPLGYFVMTPPAVVVSRRGPEPEEPDEAARQVWRLDVDLDSHARDVAWLAGGGFLPPPRVADWDLPGRLDHDRARQHARLVRRGVGRETGPLDNLIDFCAHWGLHLLVVDRDADGASMQVENNPGVGAAVIGGRVDPGRRRFTAAHELGHHILQDPYSNDAGLAVSRDEREQTINAFAQELLLPREDVRQEMAGTDDQWAAAVRLAASYRVSWSVVVRSAAALGLVDEGEAQKLRARQPVRGDFLAVVGAVPQPDLPLGATSSQWKKAVLSAYTSASITGARALELLHGAATSIDELPVRNEADVIP